MDSLRLGIDLGGTKTEIIALDSRGNELKRHRMNSPRNDYAATILTIRDMVIQTEHELGRKGTVGIGIPGTLSPATGLVKNANSTWLIGQPLDADLEEALGRPVRLANDADCFALSEATDGAGAGAAIVFGVILGTGVGGGVIVHGHPLSGPNAIAGEWGHNPLPWPTDAERPGAKCYCGHHGCIETFLSGPGLARDHEHVTGEHLTTHEIIMRAEEGDTLANDSVNRYEHRLAKALASVINVIDPHVIVLGGGMSNIPRLYGALPSLLPHYVFSDRVDTVIRPPVHGDSSGVRGAAWLWSQGECGD